MSIFAICRWIAALALCVSVVPAQAAPADMPLAVGAHEFDSAGVRLWYRVAGVTHGEPVVFLHGGPGEGSQTFATFAGPSLERSLRMVYLDQRGSGRSQRPKEASAYSMALLVDDVERLRVRLGAPRIVVIGHSFGTALALEYAARYPERVSHLILAGAVPDLPALLEIQCRRLAVDDPAAYKRAATGIAPGTMPSCNAFAAYPAGEMKAHISRNMFPDPATGELVDRTDAADGLGNSGELSGAMFGGGFIRYRFAHIDALTMPVLIIAGGKDFQAVIAPQRALVAKLPHAHLVEYPDNGHFMFVEDPARFARDVADFLRPRR